jgi:hypothetical protein
MLRYDQGLLRCMKILSKKICGRDDLLHENFWVHAKGDIKPKQFH